MLIHSLIYVKNIFRSKNSLIEKIKDYINKIRIDSQNTAKYMSYYEILRLKEHDRYDFYEQILNKNKTYLNKFFQDYYFFSFLFIVLVKFLIT